MSKNSNRIKFTVEEFDNIVASTGLSTVAFGKGCGVAKGTIYKWRAQGWAPRSKWIKGLQAVVLNKKPTVELAPLPTVTMADLSTATEEAFLAEAKRRGYTTLERKTVVTL